ncbi:centrosomal protein 295 isoform X3 [Vanacampus margaritifer]
MARRMGKLRLSPNEEAQLIQEERERRRILRIQQVREQQKYFALQTRQNVEQRRQRELELLGQELREEWEQQQRQKLRTLQMLYEQSLQMVGQGQRMAKENEPDLAAITHREALNHAKAEERFRDALKELKSQRLKDTEMQSRTINARKKALEVEKERSTKVANLPAPPPNPILQAIESGKSNVGNKSDVSAFASTRYHMSAFTVDREEDTEQADAHEGAELAMKTLLDFQRDGERKRAEQMETARLRGKTALRKEHQALDRDRLLVELEHMQQADMLRRRQQASQMPPQMFQPAHRRQEMKEDFQRDMEFAFEDMYTRERKIKGDLVERLVPEPLPVMSTNRQDPDLDVTLDEAITSEHETSKIDTGSQESACVDTVRAAPRQALTNLLDRIRNQRNESTSHNGGITDAHSLVTVASRVSERDAEVIPERDAVVRPEGVAERDALADKEAISERETTIDTGSLSSQPTRPPSSSQAVKQTAQPVPAETPHRDALSSKILEFEAERKKREMELEKEKQQQMALLQELEDQKAQLEQMLLEAQQEEKHPKADVIQEIPLNEAEVPPVRGQEVYQRPELLIPEHTRKIRECQERLLEQNRSHQHSMDLARQRLEEYQRSLQSRHNVATPPPPLHLPSAKPQIAAEVTSRGFAGPSSPPSLPSSSVGLVSSLHPLEPFESFNIPRHHTQDVSDPALLTRKVVLKVAERARSQSATATSHPANAAIRKVLPPKMVTRELLPPDVVTRVPSPPQVVTRVPSPPQVVTRESLPFKMVTTQPIPPRVSATESRPPQGVTRESRPPQVITRESRPPQGITRESCPPQVVTRESRPPQGVTRESRPPQGVTRESCPPQVVTRESRPPQGVTRESRPPQGVTRESRPPQVVTRESRPPQGVTRESLPFKMVTRESLSLKPVTREPIPQVVVTEPSPSQVVTRKSLPPKPVTAESLPLNMVTIESHHPKPVTREVLPPQALIRESFTLKPLAAEVVSSKGVTASFPFRPIQTVTEKRPPRFGSPAEDVSDQRRPHGSHERQQDGERKSLDELRQRQRESLDILRQQKETLRALMHVDAQPHSEVSAPEDTGRTRLELLSSLLKIIEKSNGGSLSHSGHLTKDTPSLQLPSTSETASRAAKPPVTRVRLDMMRDRHELSAIQEVETPVDTSQVTGPEDVFSVPQHAMDWSLQEPYESPGTSQQSLQISSMSSSRRSTPSLCREKPAMGTGTSPGTSEHGSYHRLSSDSERGTEYFVPPLTISRTLPDHTRPPRESAHGPPDLDSLSTTTLSTGSYITTDPEANAGKSPTLGATETFRLGSSSTSAAGRPQPAVLGGSNVQRIIDQYAEELDVSLSAAGKSTGTACQAASSTEWADFIHHDNEGSVSEELHSSLSQQSLHVVSESRGEDDEASCATLPSQAARTSDMNLDQTVHPILEPLPVCDDQDSFRPLTGQVGDQSSCLLPDQRETTMEWLVGQPSAYSSMIGPPAGPPPSAGWDLTLSRIMEQASQESSQRWRSGERDLCAGQLTSRTEQLWLDERPEESPMRPLVGVLDMSSGQDTGSSGERTGVGLSALTEATIPPFPSLPPEASYQTASVPGRNLLTPDAHSFHPLPVEVTNNETADPSAAFADSSTGQLSSGEFSVSPHSDLPSQGDASESELSTEGLRTEGGSRQRSTWHCGDSPQVLRFSQSDASNTSSAFIMLSEEDEEEEHQRVEVPIAEVKPEHSLNLRMRLTAKLLEAGSTEGILEQSEITLLSLTDTTLQDSVAPEEDVRWEEEEQKDLEECQTTIMEEPSEDQSPTHAGVLLEFNWGSRRQQGVFEEKRQALQERSARRAEQVKAKGVLARTGGAAAEEGGKLPSAHRTEQVKGKGAPGKTGATVAEVGVHFGERPPQTRQGAKVHKSIPAKSTMVKQIKSPTPPAVSTSTKLNKQSQVKKSKQKVAEMHRRTQRLYEQLEEVKQRKAVQNQQEVYASNRQKAKAFHIVNHHSRFFQPLHSVHSSDAKLLFFFPAQKTLQKLRGKQTRE